MVFPGPSHSWESVSRSVSAGVGLKQVSGGGGHNVTLPLTVARVTGELGDSHPGGLCLQG